MSSSWAINTLRRVAVDLQRFSDGRRIDEDQLDAFSFFNMLDSSGQLAMECVRRALENIERMQEEDNEQEYRHPVITGNHYPAATGCLAGCLTAWLEEPGWLEEEPGWLEEPCRFEDPTRFGKDSSYLVWSARDRNGGTLIWIGVENI